MERVHHDWLFIDSNVDHVSVQGRSFGLTARIVFDCRLLVIDRGWSGPVRIIASELLLVCHCIEIVVLLSVIVLIVFLFSNGVVHHLAFSLFDHFLARIFCIGQSIFHLLFLFCFSLLLH